MSPRHHRRGPLPWKFYAHLRTHHEVLRTWAQDPSVTSRHAAARLGLPRSTVYRLLAFVRAHRLQLEKARLSGNWSPIEEILFGHHPHFRTLPTYARALVALGLASDAANRGPSQARPPKRPRRTRFTWRSLWRRLWNP